MNDTSWQTMLRNLIDARRPEEATGSSFEDFHARGLAYVNLLRTPELTAKLYFAWPGIAHNRDGWLVSPHDHAYRFHTFVVAGGIRHIVFDEVSDWPGSGAFHRFRFRSALNPSPGIAADGPARLVLRSMDTLRAGDSYYLDEDEVHTIAVTHVEPTILFLLQYAGQKSETQLYCREASPPSLDGLYGRMGAERARDLLDFARQAVGSP